MAVRLADSMHRDGCRPKVVTYSALISACTPGVIHVMLVFC